MKIRIDGQVLKIHCRPYNSGGHGGQHGNRTLNAIEVKTQLPDGRWIRASSTRSKCQHTNRKRAENALASRVVAAMKPQKERRTASLERVRTYHAADNRVVDHASGERRTYSEVFEGVGFDELVDARREALSLKKALE